MKFDVLDDAYDFYCDYAKMAGFDVRKGRKSPQVQWFYCNKQGFSGTKGTNKQTEKGSMRIGCKGHVKVKLDPRESCWFFDIVDMKHNHQLHLEKQMTHFMCTHKSMEDGVKNLMDVMTRAGVHHQAQMNVMLKLYGGRDNWTFTERDLRNRFDQLHTKTLFSKFMLLFIFGLHSSFTNHGLQEGTIYV
jgi:hypothetical protein